jgi:membrane-bound ClpP family serine protease
MKNSAKSTSTMDVKDKNGKLLGAVCVAPAKEIGKRDILLMDEKTTQSVRSITELINMLSKKNVSFEERKQVLDFLSERLRYLEKEITLNTLKTLKDSQ